MRTESREGLAYLLQQMQAELKKEQQKLVVLEQECVGRRAAVGSLQRRIEAITGDLEGR